MKRLAALALPLVLATAQANDEVPFVTSAENVTNAMLRIARVSSRDYVIDLGSGDGRIVIAAAKQFGARGLGVEIVADLVKQSREKAKALGVEDRAEFVRQDLFETDLSKATVVTMYLLPEVNLQLRPRLLDLKPGTRIVSHDWDMGDWEPDRTMTVPVPDKTVGVEKSSKIMLWTVPPKLAGLWCGSGTAAGTTLAIEQRFQKLTLRLKRGDKAGQFEGLATTRAIMGPRGGPALRLRMESPTAMKVIALPGDFSSLTGGDFKPGTGASCPAA